MAAVPPPCNAPQNVINPLDPSELQSLPQQPMVILAAQPAFGKEPARIICANCKVEVVTQVKRAMNWGCCYLFFIFSGLFVLLLLRWDGLKHIEHYCPLCHSMLARVRGWNTVSGCQRDAAIFAVLLIISLAVAAPIFISIPRGGYHRRY